MSEPKLCCNCLHCARWRTKDGIKCHCDLDDRYLGYLQVMDEENDCKHWEKETKWDLQREHDKQIREKMIESCVTPNQEVFEMCDEHYLKGRKDAIDEFANEIFILISLKNVNCFYDFTIEDLHNLKTDIDDIAKKLKGGAE